LSSGPTRLRGWGGSSRAAVEQQAALGWIGAVKAFSSLSATLSSPGTNQLVFYLFHIPASSSFNPLPLHKQASRCLSFLPCIAGRAQMLRRALTARTNGGVQAKEEETNKKRKNIWSKKLLTCGPNKYF